MPRQHVKITFNIKGREISYRISTIKEVNPQRLWEGFKYAKGQLRLLDRLLRERKKRFSGN